MLLDKILKYYKLGKLKIQLSGLLVFCVLINLQLIFWMIQIKLHLEDKFFLWKKITQNMNGIRVVTN